MTPHQNLFRFIHPSRQIRRPAMIWMKLFHERTVRANDFLARGAFLKTQDFIRFILGHGPGPTARLTAPRAALTLRCRTPTGKAAIEISFQKSGALRIISTAKAIEVFALRTRQRV